jgi:hypothetical protein
LRLLQQSPLNNTICGRVFSKNYHHHNSFYHFNKKHQCHINFFGGKKTSDYLDYEATLSTSRLLHWGQVNLKILLPTYVSFGLSKRALQFLQWNRLIYFFVLLIHAIY